MNMRTIRDQYQMTQVEFGLLLQLHPQTISDIERGRRPEPDSVIPWLMALEQVASSIRYQDRLRLIEMVIESLVEMRNPPGAWYRILHCLAGVDPAELVRR